MGEVPFKLHINVSCAGLGTWDGVCGYFGPHSFKTRNRRTRKQETILETHMRSRYEKHTRKACPSSLRDTDNIIWTSHCNNHPHFVRRYVLYTFSTGSSCERLPWDLFIKFGVPAQFGDASVKVSSCDMSDVMIFILGDLQRFTNISLDLNTIGGVFHPEPFEKVGASDPVKRLLAILTNTWVTDVGPTYKHG